MGKKSERKYWDDLAELTGLQLKPRVNAENSWQYRLLGVKHNRLVMVKYAQRTDNGASIVIVLVRYAPIASETIKKQLASRITSVGILGKFNYPDALSVQDNNAIVTFPYDPREKMVSRLATTINVFVKIVARYTKPISSKVCENHEAHLSPSNQLPQLIFISGFPGFWCADCLSILGHVAEENKIVYAATPKHLFRGVIVGSEVAILSSIFYALIMLWSNRVASIVAALIFVVMIFVMEYVGTRRTIWSVLMASLLTMGSVILGTYLAHLGYAYWKLDIDISWAMLRPLWVAMWAKSPILYLALFFSLIGVVPYAWKFLAEHKQGMSLYLDPDIEIIERMSS